MVYRPISDRLLPQFRLILFKMRVITNNGYFSGHDTVYMCTVADINGLAKLIQKSCCIPSHIVQIQNKIDHIIIDLVLIQ